MAEVTGITKERADEIWNASVTGGTVDENGQLILHTRGGADINAGAIASPTATLDASWPVGSIYMATVPTNPASLIGIGTWARWGQGRVPVGQNSLDPDFDAVEEVGGVKTVTLTALQSGTRSHTHHFVGTTNSSPIFANFDVTTASSNGPGTSTIKRAFGAGEDDGLPHQVAASGHTHGFTGDTNAVSAVPAADAHTNLQPYIVCYMWKRTA